MPRLADWITVDTGMIRKPYVALMPLGQLTRYQKDRRRTKACAKWSKGSAELARERSESLKKLSVLAAIRLCSAIALSFRSGCDWE